VKSVLGKFTFRSHGRVVQRGTVLLPDRPLPCVVKQTCRPGQRGIFLVLSGPRASHPDGNLLQRVR